MKAALIVGIGGFLGSSGRYLVQQLFNRLLPSLTISGTFIANMIGCFVIGLAMSYASKLDREWLLFITTGFCGGFTTFSAFCFENVKFYSQGNDANALLYIIISIVVGLLVTYAGLMLGRSMSF